MKKLIVIGTLALSAMVYAQHGNGGDKKNHPQGSPSNAPSNNQNKQNGPGTTHGNPVQHHNNAALVPGNQGPGGNKNGGAQNGGNKNGGGQHGNAQNGGNKNGGSKNGGGKNHGNNAVHNQGHGNGGNGKSNQHNGNQGNNGQGKHGDKGNQHYGNGGKNKNHFKNITKGHPNFGYLYVNKHGVFSHKNYGQWRSQQARNKHKKYHPHYEYQAIQGFTLIIERNHFLFSEIDYKINLLRVRLAERRRAGIITEVAYTHHIQTIALLERRRAGVNINIQL